MCGRYTVLTEEENIELREIIAQLNKRHDGSAQAQAFRPGEIFPTNIAPVLVAGDDGPQAQLMQWGFPRWDGGGVVINARAETADEKTMFRSGIRERRCVIPTSGFFEWRRREDGQKTKEKYHFRLATTPMLYLAGVYGHFSPQGKAPFDGYVILTCAANASIEAYHNRMPLVLPADTLRDYLESPVYATGILRQPCQAALVAKAAG